jgi:hypothetical protein
MKVDLRAGVARGQGRDRLFGVITQVYGSDLADVMAGAAVAENLMGYGGDDVLRGRGAMTCSSAVQGPTRLSEGRVMTPVVAS